MSSNTVKHALVTGAGSGIGYSTCVRLLKDGWAVTAIDIAQSGLDKLRDETGGRVSSVILDVTSAESVTSFVSGLVERGERIDALVNSAGISQQGAHFLDLTESQWDALFAVNVKGAFLLSQAVARVMSQARSGVIVHLSSCHTKIPGLNQVAYAASKAALSSMAETMATDLAQFGIRVVAVAPGSIATAMNKLVSTPEGQEAVLSRSLIQRIGTPEDVAEVVAFAVSDAASFVTATTLDVDGGYIARRNDVASAP